MILFLDTTRSDVFLVGLVDENGVFRKRARVKPGERRGDVLFGAMQRVVRTVALHAVLVVSGPGHFSGVRHGVVAANTLAYAKGIPVVGVERLSDETNDALIRRGLTMVQNQHLKTYAVPVYGKEPTITLQ